MNTLVPAIADLFPDTLTADVPIAFEIGFGFDTAAMPEPAARQVLDLLGHLRPHPVGAAMARCGEWVLVLPPGSGHDMHWPWPVVHRDEGVLAVPPLRFGPDDGLHWVRRGNGQGRVFTAPLPLYAALRSLASLQPEYETARFDRTPVRT